MKFTVFFIFIIFSLNLVAETKIESLKDVEYLIKKEKISTIEEFLSALPIELRKRYHLAHKTRGAQFASPEYPRVIMSSFENKLTLSFTTDPNHRTYGSIELFEYTDKIKDFTFQSISFSKDGNIKPSFSKYNPSLCMHCHHNSAMKKNRPIWDHAYVWSGLYGGIFDIYSWNNSTISTPGHKVEYVNGEKLAYDKFIYPKLEKTELFKYLPKDIFTELNGYQFRAPMESPVSTNFSILNSRVNTDSFFTHMNEIKKDVDQLIYPISYIELCAPDLESGAEMPKEFTAKELYDFGLTFLSKDTLEKIIILGGQNIGIDSGVDTISTLNNIINFLKEKTFNNVNSKTLSVCSEQNDLLKKMGSNELIDCDTPFTSTLRGIDPIYEDYIDLFNNLDKFTYRFNLATHLYLSLVFKSLDFPYEYWSASRELWKSWTTHNQGARNISYSLLTRPFVAKNYPELSELVSKRVRRQIVDKYSNFFLEIPNYPAKYTDKDELINDGYCQEMASRSKNLSSAFFNY